MTITLTPDVGVPLPDDGSGAPLYDFDEVVHAAAETAALLEAEGLKLEFEDEDVYTAEALVESYAADPEKTSQAAKPANIAKLTPESLVYARNILDEFGQQVVTRSVEIRHLVTNKLILESENPDARIRMRALELLGKISDVGLFTERSEVTITHQSTDDLKNALKDKLNKLKSVGSSSTYTPSDSKNIEDAVFIEGEVIDIEAELGVDTGEDS